MPERVTGTGTVGFRTYEVFQRERVGQSTALIVPRQLMSREFLRDPYPTLAVLREHYPCYRDWSGNAFWITRYDDVTSVFMDDANYETRSKLWWYGLDREAPGGPFGRDLAGEPVVRDRWAALVDSHAPLVADALVTPLVARGGGDLAREVALPFPIHLLAAVLDLPAEDVPTFAARYWRMQRGVSWDPKAEQAGREAITELVEDLGPLVEKRRAEPGDDLISAVASVDVDGRPATAEDLVVTLLERDHETLAGALANLWFLLLTHPDQLEDVIRDRRLVRFAHQEALRHSTPVLAAPRFARHEVERFGRLLPEGALVMCSAAAGNRDPRVFEDPDAFVVTRKDICQREPRGTYRADGLPAAITVGLGQPSRHPAVPEDRPRSTWAFTRDLVVLVSQLLLDAGAGNSAPRLADGAQPELRCLRLGEMHTCWSLPVLLR